MFFPPFHLSNYYSSFKTQLPQPSSIQFYVLLTFFQHWDLPSCQILSPQN